MKVTFEQLKAAFNRVLISRGVDSETADACAEMFARTTESGVYSHGVNRFPRFIQQLENGDIIPDAQPKRITSLGAIEQWDAQRSIGNLTAKKMMDRAIELAADHGIGLVALRNANHWMRGGSYGWQAAEKGYIGICWTNSIAVMPPWGAKECRIGTNPLIVAIPSTPITMVDMSMSMFSYGMLEVNRLAGRQLPVDGGFDDEGNLTKDLALSRKSPHFADGLLERFGHVDCAGYDRYPAFLTAHRLPKSPRTTATNTAFHKFLLPLKWTSLSTVPPAMPNCNALWITLPVPSVLTKIRPFAYPATNLLPCWQKTAVTVLPLMTACGQKFQAL